MPLFVKINRIKVGNLFVKIAYAALFTLLALLTILHVSELVTIMTADAEKIKDYPFGTEQGYAYTSVETYQAVIFMRSYIGITALTSAAFFYRYGHMRAALLSVALPVLVLVVLWFF